MSVFNCNITYRKISNNPGLSTKNLLVAQGFIDENNNVLDEAKLNLAIQELGQSKVSLKLSNYILEISENENIEEIVEEDNFYNIKELYSLVSKEEYDTFKSMTGSTFEMGSKEEIDLINSYLEEMKDGDKNNFNIPCI